MWNRTKGFLFAGVCGMILVGCTGFSKEPVAAESQQTPPSAFPRDVEDLAGTWEYVDTNGSFRITLDEEGQGTYDWKEGSFETVELEGGVWKGKWYQLENDREGKFTITFSPHSAVGQGKWWYTRIGSDTHPLEPGGEFIMKPLPGVMASGK